MSNTYVKVTIENKCFTQDFYFKVLKVCRQISFWGAPTHADGAVEKWCRGGGALPEAKLLHIFPSKIEKHEIFKSEQHLRL